MSLLFSRLQENVTSTIFCNCNPDIDFIYSSVRRLFLFFIYFHQSAQVSKKPYLAVCPKYLNCALS